MWICSTVPLSVCSSLASEEGADTCIITTLNEFSNHLSSGRDVFEEVSLLLGLIDGETLRSRTVVKGLMGTSAATVGTVGT